jgi:NAD(P)-dependent dehydrogenase (short-subunit alcohol dehydrogenase family)
MTTSSETPEHVIVTGASVGMGAATARELACRGFHVLAGVRRDSDADAIRGAGIEPVILDITDHDQIAALAARFRGTLRALVNNAGIAANGPVETLPLSEWRRTFEVNLFGHVAVTQAFLPALLRSKGRIVNISSIGGKVAMASYGAYAGSKFALEAMSDALRREVSPLGVQVIVVEPGGVQTEMSVRTRYTIGRDAAIMSRLTRVLPDRLLDRLVAADLRAHYPAAPQGARNRQSPNHA